MAGNRAQYEEALEKGHSYGWDQRWQESIREFELAMREYPNEPAPYAGLGMAFFELSRYEKALENYKHAARLSQGDIMHLRRVADLQERLLRPKEAAQTYMAIGEVQLRRRLLDEAIENWSRAVRLDSDLLGGHQRLAAVYQRQGVIPAAVREYLAVARILQAQGRSEQAMVECKKALRLDSRNRDVLTAIELLRQGEPIVLEEGNSNHSGTLAANILEVGDDDLDWVSGGAVANPAQDAQQIALERLAEEIFSDDDDEADFEVVGTGLSKLERDALISQALDYQTRNMTNEAISAYEKAIEGGVTSAAAHFNLGLLYQDRLRFEDAIKKFKISLEDSDYRLGSHFSLGESYRARGRIEEAIEHFITVLKIVDLGTVKHEQADRLIQLYENLANSLLTKGEPERATAFANTLVDFLSNKGWEDKVKEARTRLDSISSEDSTMILGDILTAGSEHVLEALYLSQEYSKRGMYSAAAEEAYRSIQLSPNYMPAHLQLGELLILQKRNEAAALKFKTIGNTYQARGDLNGAISAYERVIRIAPLDLDIRYMTIELLRRMGDFDGALEQYLDMGEAYYQLAQVGKARDAYREAMNLASRGSANRKWQETLLHRMADIDMQRLDWQRAMQSYKELRRLNPDDERTAITLIDLYYKVGQPKNALNELNRYLVQLIKSGRSGKVAGILEDMVKQRPTDPGLIDLLARLYVQQKRKQKAIDMLEQLCEAQLEAGAKEQALITVEKILALNPSVPTSYQQLASQLRQELS